MIIVQKFNFNEKLVDAHSVSKFANNLDQSLAGAQLARLVRSISTALIWKLKKVPRFFGENGLIVFIYGLNFSFKMLF